jgi:hypothetical protein
MLKFDFMNYPLNWRFRDCMLQKRPVVALATLWIDVLFSTDVEVLDLPIYPFLGNPTQYHVLQITGSDCTRPYI